MSVHKFFLNFFLSFFFSRVSYMLCHVFVLVLMSCVNVIDYECHVVVSFSVSVLYSIQSLYILFESIDFHFF